jgi:hypothetical protein
VNQRYRDAARKTFPSLSKAIATNDVQWRIGNAFDTTIDYLLMEPGDIGRFSDTIRERFDHTHGDWYDDFAWWAIAAWRAAGQPHLFPSAVFQDIATRCFDHLDKWAPRVWELGRNVHPNRKPRFDGGVWNSCWSNVCPSFCEDASNTLCGIQNTVTNVSYLLAALRFARNNANPRYLALAKRQWQFFLQWFEVDTPSENLLLRVGDEAVVIRERVSTYASGAAVPGYDEKLAWTGDQGILLGSLTELMSVEEFAASARMAAWGLLGGVAKHFRGADDTLQPWNPYPPNDDVDNYRTGTGVFWRYYLAAMNDQQLREFASLVGFDDILRASAEEAIRKPGPDMTGMANDLAVLVAAAQLL